MKVYNQKSSPVCIEKMMTADVRTQDASLPDMTIFSKWPDPEAFPKVLLNKSNCLQEKFVHNISFEENFVISIRWNPAPNATRWHVMKGDPDIAEIWVKDN